MSNPTTPIRSPPGMKRRIRATFCASQIQHVFDIIELERQRQQDHIELIASENYVSKLCSLQTALCSPTNTLKVCPEHATMAAANSPINWNNWPSTG